MKRVLFLTNYPSPYRVRFYDLLGKSLDVTVLCTDPVADITHRDKEWFESGEGNFQLVQLPKAREIRGEYLCTQVISWLKKPYDAIVICGYSSPTAMLAMSWLRLHRIPYYMEVDGGLIRQDSGAKFRFKRALVRHAKCWLSSGPHTTDYLVHYGADRQRVREYPFTSLYARDILPQAPTGEQKLALRRELGMGERKIVLYVGRFTREKGMDALLDVPVALLVKPVVQHRKHALFKGCALGFTVSQPLGKAAVSGSQEPAQGGKNQLDEMLKNKLHWSHPLHRLLLARVSMCTQPPALPALGGYTPMPPRLGSNVSA